MTSSHRLLILDRDLDPRLGVGIAPEGQNPDIIADSVATISEAMERLANRGYESILCRVDNPEEVSYLIRIKHAAPALSVVALTPSDQPMLDDLALESGADDVRTRGTPRPEIGDAFQRTVGLHELIARTRAALARTSELRAENQALRARTSENVAKSRALAKERTEVLKPLLKDFMPLLVEDDLGQANLLRNAFEETGLPFPLPVARDGEDAIGYLAGEGRFGDRTQYPLPSTILLDLHLPKKSGFDVLRWIRSRHETARLAVFILSSSAEEFDRAMAEGADYFYEKPGDFGELKHLARAIAVRWWMLKKAREVS